jgi:hypothetical protein
MMFGRGHGKLAVSLVCADWRLHHKRVDLNKRLSKLLKVDGLDVIAVPGPDGLILPERAAEWKVAVQQIALLVSVHKPVALTVVAHQRCAGHPVDDGQHNTDVMATAKALKEATKFEGPVVAVVATYHNDANWGLAKIGTA